MKTTAKTGVRPPLEGQATAAEVEVQEDLAERTFDRLIDVGEEPGVMDNSGREKALAVLRDAFREAHCDATLHNVHFWDLGGQSRIVSGETVIPVSALPAVGTILTWAGKTYYIGSLREVS